MIVRNAAELLPACLESVRGVVDEIVVADTGSSDETIATATRLGAQVISIPWTDDFAAARNLSLAGVKSDWVLVLDADEQFDNDAAAKIASLLADNRADAFQVTIKNYVLSLEDRVWDRAARANDSAFPRARAYPAYVQNENVRLFRRDPEVYFVGRVHESVATRVLETGGKLDHAPFCIHHFGMVGDAETRARKNHFHRRLGRRKLRELPNNAQAHLELGLVELDNFGNLAGALELFERACRIDAHLGVAWFFRGLTLVKLQRFSEGLKCLSEAERQGHLTSLLYETAADAHYGLKQYGHACESYDRALRRDAGNPLLQSKLGLAVVRAGSVDRGLELLRQTLESNPTASELHDRLILSLVWLGRIEEAGAAAEAKLGASEHPQTVDFLRAASLWAKVKNWENAAAVLRAGLQAYPTDMTIGRSLAEVAQATDVSKRVTTAQSSSSES
jgi:glycosyltransferase involved in cell wall biosynthesis